MDYSTFYQIIAKPSFAPPSWVFGFAWGIIYPLIAIAGILLIIYAIRGTIPWYLVVLFGINILSNFSFTPLQLNFVNLLPATLDILVVVGTLFALILLVFPYNKVIFALLLPYLGWGLFATVLQVTIGFMNNWRLPL